MLCRPGRRHLLCSSLVPIPGLGFGLIGLRRGRRAVRGRLLGRERPRELYREEAFTRHVVLGSIRLASRRVDVDGSFGAAPSRCAFLGWQWRLLWLLLVLHVCGSGLRLFVRNQETGWSRGVSRERETPGGEGDEMTPGDGDGLFVCARRGNESVIGGTGERGYWVWRGTSENRRRDCRKATAQR